MLTLAITFVQCQKPDPHQAFVLLQQITLPDNATAISIAPDGSEGFWISDADQNRLLRINQQGQVLDSVVGFDRPMHMVAKEGNIYVAEYGADRITVVKNMQKDSLKMPQPSDAASGVDVAGEKLAVADFYNHRIVYSDGGQDKTFGQKGSAAGELTYPTDVQFAHGKIYVADAYNHRVQVFDLEGKHLQTIGEAEKMNASVGIFVAENALYVADFENNRVIAYSLEGQLLQIISEGLDKPTDVLVHKGKLYVANYKGRYISVFKN
jgi:DNA-binding beta-propeller fold protein YncE